MKRIYSLILVLAITVCLVACGKQEQAKETSSSTVDKGSVSQTAEPIETEAPEKQSEEVGDLPLIELEEPTTAKPDKETPKESPTEAPATEPTETPTEEPSTPPTEAPTEEPTEKPIELPFVPAF